MKSLKETLMYMSLCWGILYIVFSVANATIFIQDFNPFARAVLSLIMALVALLFIGLHITKPLDDERSLK